MEEVADIQLRDDTGVALVEIAQGLAHELHPRRRTTLHAGLNSSLERDWGFDSLSRAELLLRVERAFAVRLPEQLLGEAETLKDLLSALAGARRLPSLDATARHIIAEEPAEPAPVDATTLTEVLDWHALRRGHRHADGLPDQPQALPQVDHAGLPGADAAHRSDRLRRPGGPGARPAARADHNGLDVDAFEMVTVKDGKFVRYTPPAPGGKERLALFTAGSPMARDYQRVLGLLCR